MKEVCHMYEWVVSSICTRQLGGHAAASGLKPLAAVRP